LGQPRQVCFFHIDSKYSIKLFPLLSNWYHYLKFTNFAFPKIHFSFIRACSKERKSSLYSSFYTIHMPWLIVCHWSRKKIIKHKMVRPQPAFFIQFFSRLFSSTYLEYELLTIKRHFIKLNFLIEKNIGRAIFTTIMLDKSYSQLLEIMVPREMINWRWMKNQKKKFRCQ
jgi:hypothetical protein